jgi:hypothetical protein
MGELIIPEGQLFYTKKLNQLRVGTGKTFELSLILMDFNNLSLTIETLQTQYAEILERVIILEQAPTDGTCICTDAQTLQGYPAAHFAPADHKHCITDIDCLQNALDGKANSDHLHNLTDITGLIDDETSKISLELLPDTIEIIDCADAYGNPITKLS